MPQPQYSNFELRCPNCLSANHVEYHLVVRTPSLVMDLGSPYGPLFRHCQNCGLKFHQVRGVELKELEPVEPPLNSTGFIFSQNAL